ncbi:MAG TPA: nicotinate-nucleotide adenylyltransferase [Candidatus Eisenbergiella merdipullorum]|uniref:Probable nicotinate-nucleotide adenylyltransferase n=1 Tax=Candidatus Eisenbergiella merdipullorum TaxID=2838553 RepID=A0A9D2L1W6_9FIRM|nr:nicotinate-nucleotide adenylyltransferase [Candidatus Eisenbergiella merdipullorum]
MGGTFNPIHIGHLLLAENAYSAFGLDRILFIPSGCSYMKEQAGILDAKDRLYMTALAISGNPHFEVSDMEIRRPGYTYTCDTLEQLCEQNPDTEYYFLVGADSLFAMESWKNPEIIFQKATVLAAVRDDCGSGPLSGQAEYLRGKYHGNIFLIPSGNVDISSSDIRNRILEGRSIRYLVPEKVREYIEKNGLYLGRPDSSQRGGDSR